jgi:hypothetical protein
LNGYALNGQQYELYVLRYATAAQCAVASCPTIVTTLNVPRAEQGGVWPNPADDQVMITRPDGMAPTAAHLIDATGRLLPLSLRTSGTQAVADIRTVPAGAYVLQVLTSSGWRSLGQLMVAH